MHVGSQNSAAFKYCETGGYSQVPPNMDRKLLAQLHCLFLLHLRLLFYRVLSVTTSEQMLLSSLTLTTPHTVIFSKRRKKKKKKKHPDILPTESEVRQRSLFLPTPYPKWCDSSTSESCLKCNWWVSTGQGLVYGEDAVVDSATDDFSMETFSLCIVVDAEHIRTSRLNTEETIGQIAEWLFWEKTSGHILKGVSSLNK